jgi:hypothetical protein
MWGSIIGAVTNQVGGYFKGKQELSKVKLEAEKVVIKAQAETAMAVALSKTKMAEQGQTQSFSLDQMRLFSQSSWPQWSWHSYQALTNTHCEVLKLSSKCRNGTK